mgnify:CR=1 FL=1
MRKVYCYAEKEEKPEEIDHSGDIVKDLSSFDISDIKNRSFFFIGGEIIENPYYEPSEYMKHVYKAIDAQYEQFYRSDKDKKDAEEEASEQSPNDEMPDWIAEMPYRELIKKFPGGISEALEYAKKEKGLSVPEVHYDSPEPEKLGVKAFTKNAEVYLAPGEVEETLKHELGHVIQQKKEKISATTKIGEQQVNLDPKLEQEADEIAKHIEDHMPEIISNESTNTETKDVIQFDFDPTNPGKHQDERRGYYKLIAQDSIAKVNQDMDDINDYTDIRQVNVKLRIVLQRYWPSSGVAVPTVDLTGMNLELAKANAKQIIYLMGKYSTSIHDIKVGEASGIHEGRKVIGRASVSGDFEDTGGRTLTFTKTFFESAVKAYADGERRQIEIGNHAEVRTEDEKLSSDEQSMQSEIGKLLKYTVTHEFGHSILSHSSLSTSVVTTNQEQLEACVRLLYTKYKTKLENRKLPPGDFVSNYAADNIEDFIAECFVQAELSSNIESISRYAQKLMEIINAFFAWEPRETEFFDGTTFKWPQFKASLKSL